YGLRASPVVRLEGTVGSVSVAVPEFWQQFPKAVEVAECLVHVRFFPGQFGSPFELQGGEQKTHVAWLDFSAAGVSPAPALGWAHQPVRAHASPQWYAASGAIPHLVPLDSATPMAALLSGALDGDDSVAAGRELIDEYGWRHYGDWYADHEAIHFK